MTGPIGDVAEFDATEPLPTGTLVLEASAGTGKTYAIASLAVRFIAEGVPVDRLLLATFSNAASGELRDRTRSRLAGYLAYLDDPGSSPTETDEVLDLLRSGSPEEVSVRRRRIADALADYDAATVATTLTFCNRMLGALGFLADRAQHHPIVEDAEDLVTDLASDLYLARFADAQPPVPSLELIENVCRDAVNDVSATLTPLPGEGDELAETRREVAEAARAEIEKRKGFARVRTYSDLQQRLYDIVMDPVTGDAACARIREQFSVVLIDEFQDTDPQQWEIVKRCFHGHLPLVLVGDPKQAIYAFRGAEVNAYLAATAEAGERRRLATNRRSDPELVEALGRLFTGAAFGDPRIAFSPVRPDPRKQARQDGDAPNSLVPVRLRALLPGDFSTQFVKSDAARTRVTEDVAADIASLLSSGQGIAGDEGTVREVQPGDIAILVRTNRSVEPLQEALRRRGVSSVVRSGTSIFHTPAARHWWYVLRAVEQPSNTGRVRLAALTPLVGVGAERLDDGDDTGGELSAQFAELARVFAEGGFAAMSARLFDEFATAARVLGEPGGERIFTDLVQLSDLCNAEVAGGYATIGALAAWLGEQLADGSAMRGGDEQTRRLDRDTHAVQIMTVHASKGLEFPIVYLPFGWDGARPPDPETFLFHDRPDKTRYLDVGGTTSPARGRRELIAQDEEAGEDLRLLYVALTRARSQVVLWWAPSYMTDRGPLHRLLFTVPARIASGDEGRLIETRVPVPEDDAEIVAGLRAACGDGLGLTVGPAKGHPDDLRWTPPSDGREALELDVARFTRTVDQAWRRTSYSAIVAGAHGHTGTALVTAGSEPEDGLVEDEPVDPPDTESVADSGGEAGTPSLMNGLPYGAAFGTLVHEVLEHVDTSAEDITVEVRRRTAEGAARRGVDDAIVDQLAEALVGVLTTPLGFGDLWSIRPADRLAELDFELPLAEPGLTLRDVGDLLASHLSADDPLRDYADAVREISQDRFRGFLTGSIDSVLRTPGAGSGASGPDQADAGFVVVDYKTNRIRPGDLTLEDFSTEAMAGEMMASHYPLQALFYSVALHRFLRWRQPGYSPEKHLGPVQYHFVRGMGGPQTPSGLGVFEWRPPAALITALSDLIGGEGARG